MQSTTMRAADNRLGLRFKSDTSWLRCRTADDYNTNFGSSSRLVQRERQSPSI